MSTKHGPPGTESGDVEPGDPNQEDHGDAGLEDEVSTDAPPQGPDDEDEFYIDPENPFGGTPSEAPEPTQIVDTRTVIGPADSVIVTDPQPDPPPVPKQPAAVQPTDEEEPMSDNKPQERVRLTLTNREGLICAVALVFVLLAFGAGYWTGQNHNTKDATPQPTATTPSTSAPERPADDGIDGEEPAEEADLADEEEALDEEPGTEFANEGEVDGVETADEEIAEEAINEEATEDEDETADEETAAKCAPGQWEHEGKCILAQLKVGDTYVSKDQCWPEKGLVPSADGTCACKTGHEPAEDLTSCVKKLATSTSGGKKKGRFCLSGNVCASGSCKHNTCQ